MFTRPLSKIALSCLSAALTIAPAGVHASYPPGPSVAPPPVTQTPIFQVPQPDLRIVLVSKKSQTEAIVFIHNYGNAPAAPCVVTMRDIQGQNWVLKNGSNTNITIPAGGESWLIMKVAIPVDAPGHIMVYTVDAWNTVSESDEKNNNYRVDNVPK